MTILKKVRLFGSVGFLLYAIQNNLSDKNSLYLNFQLTCLMSEIGLNIQEAHAFCTIDGYSLDVFVVDGWEKVISGVFSWAKMPLS